ncbi:accessory Sec system protein Asp2 [Bacillus sp. GB_SG_008]|uniref:accessory Sec system protein Asp2 n=1 Tax=Bacillus sp. GB_SG_008 TaxID=3454627 RepID=UPI003F8387C7
MKVLTIGTGSQLLFDLYDASEVSLIGSICKTNIVSLISNPITNLQSQHTEGINHFVSGQLKKDYFKYLSAKVKDCDYIILDFLDEMHDYAQLEDSFITLNYDVQQSSLMDILKDKEVRQNKFSEQWCNACLRFIDRLKQFVPSNKIILHEMYLAEKYVNNGELLQFSNVKDIQKTNEILKKKYTFFKQNFKGVNIISIDENYADANHKYLLRPHLLNYSYYEKFYDHLYNTFDLTQELYKIPIDKNIQLNLPANIKFTFLPGGEAELQTYLDINYKEIVCWTDYYDRINKKEKTILPKLKKNAQYILECVGISNVDLKLRIEFYDSKDKLVDSMVCQKKDLVVKTPKEFASYQIYLQAEGMGEAHIQFLKIRRFRRQGYVTGFDHILANKDSEDIKYIFEKHDSPYLVVVFHGFNPYNTAYEFLGVLKDVKVNKLYLLDDYGLNGRFYQDVNRKDNLQQNIIQLIERLAEEQGIVKDNIITLGGSKGGGSATYYGLRMNIGHVIAGGPPLYLGIFNTYYNHHISFLNSVAGGITQGDVEYIDDIIPAVARKGNIKTKLHFLSITNDIYYEGYFEKFSSVLEDSRITYNNDLRQGKGHQDLPKHLGTWAKETLLNIISDQNQKVKMLIFGSCDSRDIFRVYEEHNGHPKYEIIDYYARSSLASVTAKPIPYKEEQISLSSNFRRKSLHRDLDKAFIKNLKDIAKKVDYLVIDFMEERFDILRYNNTHLTRSWEYRESNLQNEFNATILDRFDSEVTKIWEENCSKFIEELKKYFRPEQIILNEIQMVKSYLKDNQMYLFENQDYICKFNKLLVHYHQYFKENFEGINVIKPKDEDYFYCDSKHLWGCFPYHFNDRYYLELERQIGRFID